MTAGYPGSVGVSGCAGCGEGNRQPCRMTAAGFRRLCNGLMRELHCRTGMTAVLPWNRETWAYPAVRGAGKWQPAAGQDDYA